MFVGSSRLIQPYSPGIKLMLRILLSSEIMTLRHYKDRGDPRQSNTHAITNDDNALQSTYNLFMNPSTMISPLLGG